MNESFEEEFPQVEGMRIEVEETDLGGGKYRKHTYTQLHYSDEFKCTNRLCKKSGASIWRDLTDMVRKKETEKNFFKQCEGYEDMGGPTRPCMRGFDIHVTIIYRENADRSNSGAEVK